MRNFTTTPQVAPPAKWIALTAVKKTPDTRWWVERGASSNFKHWLRDLQDHLPGDLIPLQWVPQYVGVTRGAVKKRLDAGSLTAFSFIVVEPQRTMHGKRAYRETKSRFDYMIISECEAWRDKVLERLDPKEQERYRQENEKRQRRRKQS